MELVIGLFIALFTVLGIVVLAKVNNDRKKNAPVKEETSSSPASDCCGAHEVCEFDLIKADATRIEYYDDEELDEYKNIDEKSYSENQIDEFRDVLYTLKTDEIRYWLLSIERRKIQLPSILQSEARMLMAEA